MLVNYDPRVVPAIVQWRQSTFIQFKILFVFDFLPNVVIVNGDEATPTSVYRNWESLWEISKKIKLLLIRVILRALIVTAMRRINFSCLSLN